MSLPRLRAPMSEPCLTHPWSQPVLGGPHVVRLGVAARVTTRLQWA
jgi:hypothetical protein